MSTSPYFAVLVVLLLMPARIWFAKAISFYEGRELTRAKAISFDGGRELTRAYADLFDGGREFTRAPALSTRETAELPASDTYTPS